MNNFKRFLSVFVAGMLVLSSINFTAYISKAEPSAQSSNETAVYDFEGDASSDFHWWATGGEEGSKAEVKTDTDGNKVLSLKAANSWQKVLVNLTYELEANTKYKISYRFKSIGDTKICNTYTASGLFIGKNAPNSKEGAVPITSKRLAVTYGADTGDTIAYPTEWTYATHQIDTGDLVDDASKYFIFRFLMTAGTVDSVYGEIYLDDIVIKKIDPNIAEYDFEGDASSDFHWWATGGEEGSKAEVKTDTDGNKVLSLKAANSWQKVLVNLTYELEANTKYKISYRFKSIGDTKICNTYTASGLFIGKNAPNSKEGAVPITSKRLAVTYGADTGDTIAYPTEWTYATHQIDTGDLVDDASKYFIFRFLMTAGTVDSVYGEIYLDDIVITKLQGSSSSSISFKAYINGGESSEISLKDIKGIPGTTKALDCLDVPGYKRLGIYKDAAFTDEFTETELTILDAPVTYHVKYEPIPVNKISFVAYEGDSVSKNISINDVDGIVGTEISFDYLRVKDYNVVGIYEDAGRTVPFGGDKFTIGDGSKTYYIQYAAKEFGGGVYDFETDAKSFLDFATEFNTYNKDFNGDGVIDGAFAKVMTENAGTEQQNKFLRIQNQTYKHLVVNFPYKLKNGSSYRISFKIRDDGASNIYQDATKKFSGFYVGKSTGKVSLNTSPECIDHKYPEVYLGAKLHNLYGDNGQYVPINKTEFTDVSFTFTVGDNDVNDEFCYLAINYLCSEKNGGAFEYIDIDDIKIQEVSSIRFNAYLDGTETTDLSIATVEGNPGSTVSLDCLSIAGYDIEGIYEDSSFATKFTDDAFTFSAGSKTYYVKYVRNKNIYRFKMENSSDIKNKNGQAMVMDDPVNSGNKVLAFGKNWRESLASFPYELKPNTTYALKLSYRSSSEGIVPRLYVYAVKGDSELLDGSSNSKDYEDKRIFSIMDALNSSSANSTGATVTDNFGKWITKEYVFTTGDKIDGDYKYFALGGKVQHTFKPNSEEYLLVDNIEIKKLDATVSFNISYDGQKIDVPNTYPSVGDTITLPTAITNPFELEGWYYDSACTKPVGSTLTVTDKNTVLYGKATKKNTYTIDFEDNTDLVDGWGNWFGIGAVVTTDPDNSANHVLKTQGTAFGNYILVRLNYQLQSNRIYEISVKYRGVDQSASIALIASKIRFPENGMGVLSGPESNRLQNSILPFVTQANVPSTWQTASLKITTDQPEITDDMKYLSIYFENRVSNTGAPNNKSLSTAYIDEITITDIGKFDPSSVVIEDAGKWTLPKEDSSIWKDWFSWITGKIESIIDTDNDDNQNDNDNDNDNDFEYNYENSGNSFEVDNESAENTENTVEQQPNRKKKVIKKVIVTEGSNTGIIVGGVVAAVVLVAGGLTAFLVIKKRRGRRS